MSISFHFSGLSPQGWDYWVYTVRTWLVSPTMYDRSVYSSAFWCCLFFSHSLRYVVISHRDLNLHFPNGWFEHLSMSSSVKCLCMSFAHLVIGLFFFYFWAFRVLFYFQYKSFFRNVVCKYFFPDCSLLFHSFNKVFGRRKLCIFVVVKLIMVSCLRTLHLALSTEDFLICFP